MKTIKNLFAVILISVCSVTVSYGQSMYGKAAEADVKVKYVYSLEEAMKRAKEENKLIFFNCFADWATPCHSMNKVVFSDQEFGDYLNNTFVNLILDLSHKENIPIKDKYKVRFFAHYLILDANGEVVHRIVGGSPLPTFKHKVARSLNPKTSLTGMEKEYASGNRKVEFLREYFDVVSDAGYSDIAEKVREEYLSKIKKSDLAKKENWDIFLGLAQHADGEWFKFLKENKNEFIKNNGLKNVQGLVSSRYMSDVIPFISSTLGYRDEHMADVLKGLRYFEIDTTEDVYWYYNLALKRNRSSVTDFVSYLEKYIDKIHPTYATGIDVSLKNLINVTDEEKKVIEGYLSKRMVNMKGSSLQLYQTAIREIKNENGIVFEDGEFELALKKAKKENKLIFLDAYTTWCGPCKVMAQQVFTLDTVGNVFNKTYVNYKMDMEKGEGPKWARKYQIEVYPTFLLINGDGEIVHKITGAHNPNTFMDLIGRGNNEETAFSYVKKEYAAGSRSPQFIYNYVVTMKAAGELNDPQRFIEDYYKSLSDEERKSSAIWPIVQEFGADLNSAMLASVINNKKLFNELLSEPAFLPTLERIYAPHVYRNISEGEKSAGYAKAKKDLAALSLPQNSTLNNLLEVEKLVEKSDYSALIQFYKNRVYNMTDNKGKMNLDLLWKNLFLNLDEDQKDEVLTYLKKQHELADSRAINSYKSLLNSLL